LYESWIWKKQIEISVRLTDEELYCIWLEGYPAIYTDHLSGRVFASAMEGG